MIRRVGRFSFLVGLLTVLIGACVRLPPISLLSRTTPETYLPGELLIGFVATLSETDRQRLRDLSRVTRAAGVMAHSERWELPPESDPQQVARAMSQNPGVRYAQPNYRRSLPMRFDPSARWADSALGQGSELGVPGRLAPGKLAPGKAPRFRVEAYAALELNVDQDAMENQLWHLALIGVWRAWQIDRPGNLPAFSTDNAPGKGILVAVVDSGVDIRHPDLEANIARDEAGEVRFLDEIKKCGRSDDAILPGTGVSRNFDFYESYGPTGKPGQRVAYSGPNHPGPDGNGHGTHVAGIIAAVGNNRLDVDCREAPCNAVGVGPGIAILPVKTMNAQGDGDDFCISQGLRDAADAGAKIINLSVGGPQPGPALEEAIEYLTGKGVLLVVASGNDGLRVNFPAAYPGAIAVGAVGHPADSHFPVAVAKGAPFSSSGPELDLVAPGGSDTPACPERRCGVFSSVPTYPTEITAIGKVQGPRFGRLTGTSMAAPQVTATAALLLAREPTLSPEQIRARLISTAMQVPTTAGHFSERFGYGLLDPFRALAATSHDGN